MKILKKISLSIFVVLLLAGTAGILYYFLSPDKTEKPTDVTGHSHDFKGGQCVVCGFACEHEFQDGICKICGEQCNHKFENKYCIYCGTKEVFYKIAVDPVGGEMFDGANAGGKIECLHGSLLEVPPTPIKDGYVFAGWYEDLAYSRLYQFTKPVESEITLYARWTKLVEGYLGISFDTLGGTTVVVGQQIRKGHLSVKPTIVPVKEGYVFAGWYTERELENQYTFDITVSKSMMLYAKWVKLEPGKLSVSYTIAESTESGSGFITKNYKVLDVQLCSYGNTVSPYSVSDRNGSILQGWYYYICEGKFPYDTEEEIIYLTIDGVSCACGKYDFSQPVTEDLRLYAVYYRICDAYYTVNFNTDGANGIEPLLFRKNLSDSERTVQEPTLVKDGYRVEGWYKSSSFHSSDRISFPYVVTKDCTLFVHWEADDYEVRFEPYVTSVFYKTVDAGSAISPDEVSLEPREGYTFMGWLVNEDFENREYYDFDTPVYSSFTLYADWAIVTDADSLNSSGDVIVTRIIHRDNIGKSEVYYSFRFYLEDASTGTNNLTFLKSGESLSKIDIPTVRRGNCEFIGWCFNKQLSLNTDQTPLPLDFTDTARRSLVIYPWWRCLHSWENGVCSNCHLECEHVFENNLCDICGIARYSVSFETNQGSFIQEQLVLSGKYVSEPSTPSRYGYTFDGWYLDEDCQELFDFSTAIESSITLYARWQIINWTVDFYANGGEFGNGIEIYSIEIAHGEYFPEGLIGEISMMLSNFDDRVEFSGWCSDRELLNYYDFEGPVESNLLLLARWDYYEDIVLTAEPTENLVIRVDVAKNTFVNVTWDIYQVGIANSLVFYSTAFLRFVNDAGEIGISEIPFIDEFDFLMVWDWVEIVYVFQPVEET